MDDSEQKMTASGYVPPTLRFLPKSETEALRQKLESHTLEDNDDDDDDDRDQRGAEGDVEASAEASAGEEDDDDDNDPRADRRPLTTGDLVHRGRSSADVGSPAVTAAATEAPVAVARTDSEVRRGPIRTAAEEEAPDRL